jgi:RNA polymerase sigma factor (sigma-70 family)
VTLSPDIERLLRDLTPQVLGPIVRRYGDFAAAEDAVQEALIAAADQWPREGRPDNPRGWLIRVASRKMTDHIRSDSARRTREGAVAGLEESAVSAPSEIDLSDHDDTLVLLFMCCHPSLSASSAIALTLRAVGGLTTNEIASAYLVPTATMGQRISRAKQTIKASGVGFEMPSPRERATRLTAVLHVLYLIFNEGYAASSGDALQRIDLSSEAIRLTRALRRLSPGDAEVDGLLALMLLTDARKLARSGPHGELIPLDEQDRSRWNRDAIREGTALISRAIARGSVGAYQLQAAIAALHDEATSTETTDWTEILGLYGLLRGLSDNPMVSLNHSVAAAMVHGAATGLSLIAALDDDSRIAGHYRLDAVRAHLYEMDGDRDAARRAYLAAAEKTASLPERNYLLAKAAHIAAG